MFDASGLAVGPDMHWFLECVPAMVLAALALFVVFIVTVIEMFGAITGTGFGTIFFGITLLGVVVAWRQWVGAERTISSS